MNMTLHEFLDCNYGPDGDSQLLERLAQGQDPNACVGGETPLHVAARRRRLNAVKLLLDHGADIDAQNHGGKTAYAHAIRRGFDEVAESLAERGADTALSDADRFAVAVVAGQLEEAREMLLEHPKVACTGNPEEDRLLADVAGRPNSDAVELLITAGADLTELGLDSGTPLHQAAWFGQPTNARMLIDAGAPLDVFDNVHESSPLGWAVHGSRNSGAAEERQTVYAELVRMLLDAGSSLVYPDDPHGSAYLTRLNRDAPAGIKELLPTATR